MTSIDEFFNKIKDKPYGWHDKEGQLHTNIVPGEFYNEFELRTLEDTNFDNAVCWEICELERKELTKNNIPLKTIFVYEKDNKRFPCHTFVVFKENDNYYWLEGSWIGHRGIHEYNNLKEIFDYFRNNFSDFSKDYIKENLVFLEYKQPVNIKTCQEFYDNALEGKLLDDNSTIN